jgi:hypothetical protein
MPLAIEFLMEGTDEFLNKVRGHEATLESLQNDQLDLGAFDTCRIAAICTVARSRAG